MGCGCGYSSSSTTNNNNNNNKNFKSEEDWTNCDEFIILWLTRCQDVITNKQISTQEDI